MKHSAPLKAASETVVKMPTRRALAKQQTRAKVLDAARQLFSEAGYEGATIRDIAATAGMSTGAVFANFKDKSDLFHEIMSDDMTRLAMDMRDAASRAKTVEEAVLKVFNTGYAFYKNQLPLARAALSVGWSMQDGPQFHASPLLRDLQEVVAEQLVLGVERGELSQEAEVKLRAPMLFDAYVANYRWAIFEGWSLEALQARSRDQIRVILAGARRG